MQIKRQKKGDPSGRFHSFWHDCKGRKLPGAVHIPTTVHHGLLFAKYTDHYLVLSTSLKSLFTRSQKSKTQCLILKSESTPVTLMDSCPAQHWWAQARSRIYQGVSGSGGCQSGQCAACWSCRNHACRSAHARTSGWGNWNSPVQKKNFKCLQATFQGNVNVPDLDFHTEQLKIISACPTCKYRSNSEANLTPSCQEHRYESAIVSSSHWL